MTTDVAAAVPAGAAASADAPNPNMTGEEAKAWVESQKAAKASPKDGGRDDKGKFVGKTAPPKEQSSTEMVKDAAKEAAARQKFKIDGKEVEDTEVEAAWREYQKGKAGDAKLREASALRKQAENFLAMMKNPEHFYEVAAKLGHDPRALAEKYLAAQLEDELLDPREKEFRAAKRKLKEFEDMETKRKASVEAQRHAALKDKYAKDYSEQFVAALEESKLPATKGMVSKMAKYVHDSAKIGFKMTPSEAAQLVKEDLEKEHQNLWADADGESLIKLFGEQAANKIRKWDTGRIRNPESGLKTPTEQAEQSHTRRTPDKRLSPAEWRKFTRGG